MGLPEAEYHFRSAVIYGNTSVKADDAYLPAGAFHKEMAQGLLELTLALKQIQARLDALAGAAGGVAGGAGATHAGAVLDAGVLTADLQPSDEPAAGAGAGGAAQDSSERVRTKVERRRQPSPEA